MCCVGIKLRGDQKKRNINLIAKEKKIKYDKGHKMMNERKQVVSLIEILLYMNHTQYFSRSQENLMMNPKKKKIIIKILIITAKAKRK